jgi:hypothetical protein
LTFQIAVLDLQFNLLLVIASIGTKWQFDLAVIKSWSMVGKKFLYKTVFLSHNRKHHETND